MQKKKYLPIGFINKKNMKKFFAIAAMALMVSGAYAETLKTVVFTPTPKMTCKNCEKKVKDNVRFVKGTKTIETNVPNNTVTITYDADKATIADYEAAFKKIGRPVTIAEQPKDAKKK